jgi:hypothetical protein
MYQSTNCGQFIILFYISKYSLADSLETLKIIKYIRNGPLLLLSSYLAPSPLSPNLAKKLGSLYLQVWKRKTMRKIRESVVMGKPNKTRAKKLGSQFSSLYTSCNTLHCKRNLNSCIPRKGFARPHFIFPNSCVSERFIYSHVQPTYFPAAE